MNQTTILNIEYVQQLENDLNSLRVEVSNYKRQLEMITTQVQMLQAERAQREKTITKDVIAVMENNLLVNNYIQEQIENIKVEAKKAARQELNDKANSV